MALPDPSPLAGEEVIGEVFIAEDLDRVEQELDSVIREAAPPLRGILRHALREAGRTPPALVLLTGRMLGNRDRAIVEIASAVRMIHAGTLIHDAVIGRVPAREGRAMRPFPFGESIAVLAGDFLLAGGLRKVAGLQRPELVREITSAISEMCDGRIRECPCAGTHGMEREEYDAIAHRKTAPLFAAGMTMAGIASGAGSRQCASLAECGRLLWAAFHVADDIARVTGNGKAEGRVAGSDLRAVKMTLPAIIQGGGDGDCGIFRVPDPACTDGGETVAPGSGNASPGAIQEARKEAEELIRRCRECLDAFPENRYRDAIARMAGGIRVR